MSENENVLKRSPEKTNETEQNKKIKLALEAPLILDKSQEEAIDKLVQNSHLAKEKEEQVDNKEKDSNNGKLLNKVSLPPITNALTADNKNTPSSSSSITSEQLLYALTSSVPVQADKNKDKQNLNKQSLSDAVSPSTKQPLESSPNVQKSSSVTLPTSSTSFSPSSNTKTPLASSTSHLLSNIKLSTTSSTTPTPTTTTTTTTTAITNTTPSSTITTTSTNTPNGVNTSSTTTTTTTITTAPISSNTATSSLSLKTTPTTSLGFNSLPDISAALRRLSSTPVIEPHEARKGSISDSASELLGNALAAVAARPHNHHLAAFTANISNLLHSTGFEDTQKKLASVMRNNYENLKKTPKPKLVVNNSKVFKSMEGIQEKSLGFYVYTPQFILPNLENHINGTVEIRVPARYLGYESIKVQKRALWGTDIYTDDSDVIAMVIHSGKYLPPIQDEELESNDPFALTIAGKTREALEETRKRALMGKTYLKKKKPIDYDLKVVLRVLPKLQDYASSIRNRLKSRHWGGSHDGVSLFVDKVEKIKKGEARLKGKSALKANMFIHEKNRKDALGLNEKKPIEPQQIRKGRVKKTNRVMRMFKIRAEMMNEKS